MKTLLLFLLILLHKVNKCSKISKLRKAKTTNMKQQKIIKKLLMTNNGTISHRTLIANGVSSYGINQAIKAGLLEKTRSGIYIDASGTEDIFYSLQQKYRHGIYSLRTALYLWNLSDQYPFSLDLTFPRGYNNRELDSNITPHFQAKNLASQGITQTQTFNGNLIKLYSPERTLAEILRPINAIDIETITSAYKAWTKMKKKDINSLMDFAQIFKVKDIVTNYLGVLL